MLKIWGRKTSVNVQRVMWAVGELGLAHQRVDAGGPFGGLDTAEFGRLNPNRLVPALQDGSFSMWESNASVRYLAATYGRGSLAPSDPKAFATADQWMDWGLTTLNADIIATCFLQLIRTPAADRNVGAVEAAAKRAGEKLAILDGQLAGKQFILGDTLTMADVAIGSFMYRYYNLPIARPTWANVDAWYQRLQARPAYRDHVMVDFAAMKVPGA